MLDSKFDMHFCYNNTAIIVDVKETAENFEQMLHMKDSNIFPCNASEWYMRHKEKPALRVESYQRFRGLEAAVIIAYDPPYDNSPQSQNICATMFSRATSLTVIMTTKSGASYFRSKYNDFKIILEKRDHEDNVDSEDVLLTAPKKLRTE